MDIRKIGRYQIIKKLATGGMGEIFLAYDPVCSRKIALKRIREDLKNRPTICRRFLKEAQIASQLTHPSIIPIYAIHEDANSIYYTMPYVEGKTLKDILIEGAKASSSESSIPHLIRIFLTVCEAVAFVHSKKIIHRDLKPSNILVGKYGEILILDWGIAAYLDELEKAQDKTNDTKALKQTEELEEYKSRELTHPGKIAGTITYLAPECVLGEKASVLSDIYALGVILYHILTLRSPFKRRSVEAFRRTARLERVPDPALAAPYRDIPLVLAKIVKKCLAFEKSERYQTLLSLIDDLKKYIEGKPQWLIKAVLDLKDPKAFIFQENLYLPKTLESSEWASVWLAKTTLCGSFKISFELLFKKNSSGFGILFSVPENKGKYLIEDGFLLFFDPRGKGSIELSHGSILILKNQNAPFKKGVWHQVEIEKLDNTLHCYVNGRLVLSYISYIPIFGSYSGLLFKDSLFLISDFKLFAASNNLHISCLALPDAFLAKKDFDSAYLEYRRIAASFPGRTEEREALFRAGMTVLEKAKTCGDREFFEQALLEFENLKKSAGAPLEYLGKSIVYATLKEYEEEAKCLELAIRKFQNHPLLYLLKEHLLLRLHESSFSQREAHLRLMLICLLIFSEKDRLPDTELLTFNLKKKLPKPEFFVPSEKALLIDLAFRLNKKNLLLDLLKNLNFENPSDIRDMHNIFIALLEMGSFKEVNKLVEKQETTTAGIQEVLQILNGDFSKPFFLSSGNDSFQFSELVFLLRSALWQNRPHFILKTLQNIDPEKFQPALSHAYTEQNEAAGQTSKPIFFSQLLYSYKIWALLLNKQLDKAEKLFKTFSEEERADDKSPLFIPYGVFLKLKGEEEAARLHFTLPPEIYSSLGAFFSLIVLGKKEQLHGRLLACEKKELKKYLNIYACLMDKSQAKDLFQF